MASQEYVKLAQSLPPRLLRFFARYPPPPSSFANRAPASSISTSLNTSFPPNASREKTAIKASPPSLPYPNPFESQKHPATGKWHGPVFSLRRQADLVKMARANGIEDLLPYTTKGTEERLRRRMEHGLRVKGTGVGQKVKGKLWERTMKGRLEKRRQAMLGMPKLVQQWKQVSVHPELQGWGTALMMFRWATAVVGRSGQNDLGSIASLVKFQVILMDIDKLSRRMTSEEASL
ncbi:hypothetical protein IMSHALPRED_002638 [Imshaugia aleurites]|uniref:Large ribosomal subunit protein mL59 domain-containing protein n=1 Tax=Imshaugia aleurites TaxID=172621 RepID=A0A8H3EXV6_9LECA|nr:hypothetical protein IMSHALPRED_002638 [Imshaugia aleurites]